MPITQNITIKDGCIRILGLQYGPQYKTDLTAFHQAQKIQPKYYPNFTIIFNQSQKQD